uniref:Col_cuticle_N domain-containing protein n=1 Tax=Macrostomum lignano TaxID=282301 RepID=A0A1I8FAE2_9PLAT
MAIPTIETEMKLVLFIAVMASSMTSIFILAVIALVAIKMLQSVGEVTNLSTIVSTSAVPANNRTDSGVYEDPQEPPA